MSVFAIDAKALMAIRAANGLKIEQRDNQAVHVIRMNKTTLQNFVENPKSTLKRFKLRGFGVLNRRIHVKLRGSMTDFNLALILPKRQLEQVFQLNINFSETQEVAEAQELLL